MNGNAANRHYGDEDNDAHGIQAAAAMTSKERDVARLLNEFCTSSLGAKDQESLQRFVEDYFCHDTPEEEGLDTPGKWLHEYLHIINS